MNVKAILPLVFALALGGVAAKIGKDMLAKGRQSNQPTNLNKLVVAKEDLPPGATIKETDLAQQDVPAAALSKTTYSNPGELVGRVVLTQIVKGQAVLDSLLAPKGTVGGAQAIVPQGKRAVSMEVNEYSGVAGLLTPGSHVDVVQTMRGKDDGQMIAKTIVENLTIIAVGRRTGTATATSSDGRPVPAGSSVGDDNLARSVTLLATAEQAEAIDLASHMGNPRLVLRNGTDDSRGGGKGITVAELRGVDDNEAVQTMTNVFSQLFSGGSVGAQAAQATTAPVEVVRAPRPAFREVEVIRAGASSSVRVSVNNKNEAAATDTADKEKLGTLPQER